jgi:hypothetical protein
MYQYTTPVSKVDTLSAGQNVLLCQGALWKARCYILFGAISVHSSHSVTNIRFSIILGRAVTQAVSRRSLTAEARVRAQVSAWGLCIGQSGTGAGFAPSCSVFPCHHHSTVTLHINISPGGWWPQFGDIYMNNNILVFFHLSGSKWRFPLTIYYWRFVWIYLPINVILHDLMALLRNIWRRVQTMKIILKVRNCPSAVVFSTCCVASLIP